MLGPLDYQGPLCVAFAYSMREVPLPLTGHKGSLDVALVKELTFETASLWIAIWPQGRPTWHTATIDTEVGKTDKVRHRYRIYLNDSRLFYFLKQ